MDDGVYVLIKKGDPEQLQKRKFLHKDESTIGRRGNQLKPDIEFSSPYVSRKHAVIRKFGHQYTISDLASKHGTEVNGVAVHQTPHPLFHGDVISLAKGVVELIFFAEGSEMDVTREFSFPLPAAKADPKTAVSGLVINLERREIRLDGNRIYLTGKDMDLLMLLFQRANQAVSYEEIMVLIWPERLVGTDKNVPDVGRTEINALVYRLRKRLGRYGEKVTTIPRYGYMWEE
ncbi:transcriptional regulator [Brevibacillus reuszeri]|uniref:Histidine kinase n=1 Tax=Brevibacillus reuszeri TaxID=54915 RepID=A0A0K9YMF5_9BACL|nr:FHA domain-containing protein [Brevibacillus reuszeri]KNB69345.1 histidine kinase [Brevibacillus reuszeri]MED1860354.1 FHA domain-containing protein [Brevibacillus reuszeri]GED70759.1 transcriptional regulator [Brevibacillus reuszeri]